MFRLAVAVAARSRGFATRRSRIGLHSRPPIPGRHRCSAASRRSMPTRRKATRSPNLTGGRDCSRRSQIPSVRRVRRPRRPPMARRSTRRRQPTRPSIPGTPPRPAQTPSLSMTPPVGVSEPTKRGSLPATRSAVSRVQRFCDDTQTQTGSRSGGSAPTTTACHDRCGLSPTMLATSPHSVRPLPTTPPFGSRRRLLCGRSMSRSSIFSALRRQIDLPITPRSYQR